MLHFPVTVTVCVAFMIGLSLLGARLRRRGGERALRLTFAGLCLAVWVAAQVVFLRPANFDPAVSFPLHICDVAGLLGPLALLTRRRLLLSVLYFWGFGLTTQGFITPVLPPSEGLGSIWYWVFWANHASIVGLALYAVVVLGYRPRWVDLAAAIAFTAGWLAVVLPLNLAFDWNYGYVGPSKPDAPTLLDSLGAWPLRLLWIAGLVIAGFTVLWLPWAIAGRLHRAAPADGADDIMQA